MKTKEKQPKTVISHWSPPQGSRALKGVPIRPLGPYNAPPSPHVIPLEPKRPKESQGLRWHSCSLELVGHDGAMADDGWPIS